MRAILALPLDGQSYFRLNRFIKLKYMKKLVIVFAVLVVLSGCAETSDFALKEKCAKYIASRQKLITDWNNERLDRIVPSNESQSLMGVFFSRTKNTCISIIMNLNLDLPPQSSSWRTYYDELTSVYLNVPSQFYKENYPTDYEGFEKTLNLIN